MILILILNLPNTYTHTWLYVFGCDYPQKKLFTLNYAYDAVYGFIHKYSDPCGWSLEGQRILHKKLSCVKLLPVYFNCALEELAELVLEVFEEGIQGTYIHYYKAELSSS